MPLLRKRGGQTSVIEFVSAYKVRLKKLACCTAAANIKKNLGKHIACAEINSHIAEEQVVT